MLKVMEEILAPYDIAAQVDHDGYEYDGQKKKHRLEPGIGAQGENGQDQKGAEIKISSISLDSTSFKNLSCTAGPLKYPLSPA